MICGHCKAHDVNVAHVRLCGNTPGGDNDPHLNPVAGVTVTHPVTEAGMYKLGDTIYKVQAAVHGSGHLYAKKLVVSTSGDPGDPDVAVGFDYAPGALRRLVAEDRMSLEDAKAFGALYGTCCVCGRTLTNETSIAAGIGPVCAGRV